MKYRLTALFILLSLALASCSLAEDITPPPGYQSPTPVETLISATQTPQATQTTEPATITPETSTVSAKSPTPFTDFTATPGASLGNIFGNLVNGSGGAIPEEQQVSLFGFDMDQSGTYQKILQITAPVDTQGSYSFKGVEILPDRAFLVITSFGGIEYQSDPVIVSDMNTDYSVPVTIYEKSDDYNLITFSQVHLIFDLSSQNVIQVTELFIATNPSKQAIAVTSDGTTIPFIQIPENASDLQFQLSQGSSQLLNATVGFAMLPGADKQYGFVASYTLPYNKSLKFTQPFSLPVSSLTVFLPAGMHLRGEQLTDSGSQDIQGTTYQLYQTNQMASGSSLTFTLSGNPGVSNGGTSSGRSMILIGIGIVGALLVGLGIYLYLRDRARWRRENEENEAVIEKDALGEDRDSIMDAMIALDDQYKAGEIPKEAYEERRKELKERLRSVL